MLDTCPSAARRVRAAARAQGEAAGGARPTATDWQRDARLRSMCASPPSASQKSAQGKVVGDAGQVRLYVIKRAGAGCPAPHAFRSGFLGPHTQVASREHGSCTPRHSPTEAIPTSPQGHSPTEQGVRGKKGSMRGRGGGLESNTARGRCNTGRGTCNMRWGKIQYRPVLCALDLAASAQITFDTLAPHVRAADHRRRSHFMAAW